MNKKTRILPANERNAWCGDRDAGDGNGPISSDRTRAVDLPERIGKYPVQSFLGRGGMGTVYLGSNTDLEMTVAVKVVDAEAADDCVQVKRFVREARMISEINSPYVVRIYDAGRDKGRPFLVQEYIPGGSVDDLLQHSEEGCLSPTRALRIVRQVTEALIAFAEKGIVHRDVKPGNILLDANGNAKLADLGVGKRCTQPGNSVEPELTRGPCGMGSVLYAAPEQLQDAREVDARADIYSLGVTFYRMLTGELPLAAESMADMIQKHRVELAPDAREVKRTVPTPVARVIATMLKKSPDDRYQSASELLDELRRLESRLEAEMPDDNALTRAPASFVGAGALLTSLLAFAVATLLPGDWGSGDAASLHQIENCLARGEFSRARALAETRSQTVGAQARLVYAVGMCALKSGDVRGARDALTRLKGQADGDEYADHLRALLLLHNGQVEEARRLLSRAEKQASRKLPFLVSHSALLINQQQTAEAEKRLQQAVQEAGFFDFQRFRAADMLARLFVQKGDPARAADIYDRTLNSESAPVSAPPDVYTNYAMALMDNGDSDKARGALDKALRIDPGDEMARYLRRRVSAIDTEHASRRHAQTLSLINDLNEKMKRSEASADKQDNWQSLPRILVFLPPEPSFSRGKFPAEVEYWSDQLATCVRTEHKLAVVEREHLNDLLTELKLASSGVSTESAVRLGLGKLWPASVLVKPQLTGGRDGDYRLHVRLIDVQTSEIIGALTASVDSRRKRLQTVERLCRELIRSLDEHAPLVGRISERRNGDLALTVGQYHGLAQGDELVVYDPGEVSSPALLKRTQPLGRVRVTELHRFSAVATPVGTLADRSVSPVGLVVMQKPQNQE